MTKNFFLIRKIVNRKLFFYLIYCKKEHLCLNLYSLRKGSVPMKKKRFLAVLEAALLLLPLSGCGQEGATIQPSPADLTVNQDGSTVLSNLTVYDFRGTTLTLQGENDSSGNRYFYQLNVPFVSSEFLQDAQGSPVSPEQFSEGTPVTLVLQSQSLSTPALIPGEGNGDYNQFIYHLQYRREGDFAVRLVNDPRPEAAPFESLTRSQVVSGEIRQGNTVPLGERELDQMVACLQGIQATVQTQPQSQETVGGSVKVLTLTDGSQIVLGRESGVNYTLSVETAEGTSYYCIRGVYLDDLILLTNHVLGYDNVRL